MRPVLIMLEMFALLAVLILNACSSGAEQASGLTAPEMSTSASSGSDENGGDGQAALVGNQLTASQSANEYDGGNVGTAANLLQALKGEMTASAKYAAYAKKAQEEGLAKVAALFNATSMSEKIHADNHRAVLQDMGVSIPLIQPAFDVKTTRENLVDAIAGETYEIATMYPDYLKVAAKEGRQLAQISMNYAYKTEQKHKVFYENALAAVDAGQFQSLSSNYLICPTCGNTYDGAAPKRCGISMTSGERFISVPSV